MTAERVRIDRRKPPWNKIPKKVLDSLWFWEKPVLGKIIEVHPPEEFPRVADVGGGAGRLARALQKLGYRVTIFDPEKPNKFVWVRRCQRRVWKKVKKRIKHPSMKGIRVRRRKFLVRDAADFDLLVGVRPCSASQKLVRAARKKPLVMMPCTAMCPVWPGKKGSLRAIEGCFRDHGVAFRRVGRDVFWTGESPRNPYVD